jgi:hypothetical protein
MPDDGNTDAQAYGRPPVPNPDLRSLDRLVGTWELSGDVRGTVTYEWMEGGFFLLQRVELEQQDGQRITGIEVIGHERPFGAEPSEEIRSRLYSNRATPSTTSTSSRVTPSGSGPGRGIPRPTSRARSALTTP